MSKRKGQTNGNNTRNQSSPAASGNAPEIDTAGAPPSADGAPLDSASIVDGSNGVYGAADGKGVSDAQTAGTGATETVQQPENIGLGDAAALAGGGEGSASSGSVEAAGGSDAGDDGADGDHAGGYSNDGSGGAAARSTAAANPENDRGTGNDGNADGTGGLHGDVGSEEGGLSDGKVSGQLEAGEGAAPGADAKTADTSGESVSGDIGAGSGSGSIENDGDASADGAADDGKNGSAFGESGEQAGSVGGGNPASGNDGREDDEGGTSAQSRLQRRNGRLYLRHAGESDALNTDSVAGLSDDLLDVLELAGCATAENLIDMARIGSNVMEAIDDIRKLDGPFKDWAPMDDPAEIVHDLFNALEHAREKAAAPALDPEGNPASSEAPAYVHCCPICDVPFKPDDICATDIEEGTCHAECLAGSPVVDLDTGEPSGGPICTFLYSDDVPGKPAATIGAEMAVMDNMAGSAMLSAEFAWDGAWDAFFTHTRPETCADGQPEFPLSPIMGRDLAEYVRKIGRRATPEILVQQLVILKHRQSADLGEQERIAMRTFIATLLDLDDFAAAEKKRLEDLAAEKPKPRPVPIDETNMELVDGPMATH